MVGKPVGGGEGVAGHRDAWSQFGKHVERHDPDAGCAGQGSQDEDEGRHDGVEHRPARGKGRDAPGR